MATAALGGWDPATAQSWSYPHNIKAGFLLLLQGIPVAANILSGTQVSGTRRSRKTVKNACFNPTSLHTPQTQRVRVWQNARTINFLKGWYSSVLPAFPDTAFLAPPPSFWHSGWWSSPCRKRINCLLQCKTTGTFSYAMSNFSLHISNWHRSQKLIINRRIKSHSKSTEKIIFTC